MSPLPATQRIVRLASRPSGVPTRANFRLDTVALPAPGVGEILIRNLLFRVSASLRMMISEGAENVEGVPFPALGVGDAIAEEALGEVVLAPPGYGLAPGDLVLHFAGWRDYAVVGLADCRRIDDALADRAAHLSHGWTAYAALTRGVTIRPRDTIFISSAAGAIGSMAGQIARDLGAGRVIGSTSSRAKAERLIAELGYDAVVIRTEGDLAAQLKAAAPEGVDVFLDNVGGEHLQAAVAAANPHARFVLVGALSGQLAAQGAGRSAPVSLDSFQLLLRSVTIRGYSADDDEDARPEWTKRFADGLASGRLRFPHVVVRGLENAAQALEEVSAGKHVGTVLVAP
jgi:NADPH-dependent curcumin reductase CurA